MHNKIVVADDAVITGSYNLSHSASENAENILILDPFRGDIEVKTGDEADDRLDIAGRGGVCGDVPHKRFVDGLCPHTPRWACSVLARR